VSVGRALRRTARIGLRLLLVLLIFALGAALWLVLDARRTPTGNPEYVALGSSYAAGAGLGSRQPGSPRLCQRSDDGYPPRLARKLGLSFVDMTCSGSVTRHVRGGSQFFQHAQIRTLDRRTQLVTITVGGNDVGFVRDLYLLAERNSNTALGWLVRKVWNGPPPIGRRNYGKLHGELKTLFRTIRERAPDAKIVVATYPAVLPRRGTCRQLRLSSAEVDLMRGVEDRLAAVTRSAAEGGEATVVDMHALGARHHACSALPWMRGWGTVSQSPFHPTVLGAQATADAIAAAI
jgi:lysophospholipase L1-like esterase